jgi:hypothetical protein
MNNLIKDSRATNIPTDFKAVLCAMHERQALTYEESSAHWRRVAAVQFKNDNMSASSFALVMADQLADWAKDEWAAAKAMGGALERNVPNVERRISNGVEGGSTADGGEHSTLNTQHSTLNTQHSTLNTQHSTLNTQHSTLNTQHSTFGSGSLLKFS